MANGSVFIMVAGSEWQYGSAFRSISRIRQRPGDHGPVWMAYTKGQDAREDAVQKFLTTDHDYLLFLDGDMQFPEYALERLRCHDLPCISGLYFRRSQNPMVPIWYHDDPKFRWPMKPFTDRPESGRLYRLGATGFGIWLVHREVFEAVGKLLKGERYVWEDDMDVWPYRLPAVLSGEESIKPLRAVKTLVGADIRLGYFIRQAGYTIWGDPAVSCGHYHSKAIGLEDWNATTGKGDGWREYVDEEIVRLRAQHTSNAQAVLEGNTA